MYSPGTVNAATRLEHGRAVDGRLAVGHRGARRVLDQHGQTDLLDLVGEGELHLASGAVVTVEPCGTGSTRSGCRAPTRARRGRPGRPRRGRRPEREQPVAAQGAGGRRSAAYGPRVTDGTWGTSELVGTGARVRARRPIGLRRARATRRWSASPDGAQLQDPGRDGATQVDGTQPQHRSGDARRRAQRSAGRAASRSQTAPSIAAMSRAATTTATTWATSIDTEDDPVPAACACVVPGAARAASRRGRRSPCAASRTTAPRGRRPACRAAPGRAARRSSGSARRARRGGHEQSHEDDERRRRRGAAGEHVPGGRDAQPDDGDERTAEGAGRSGGSEHPAIVGGRSPARAVGRLTGRRSGARSSRAAHELPLRPPLAGRLRGPRPAHWRSTSTGDDR